MDQIHINTSAVSLTQAFQLLVKESVHIFFRFSEPDRELVCDDDFLAVAILQGLTDDDFALAAVIGITGIDVVNALIDGIPDEIDTVFLIYVHLLICHQPHNAQSQKRRFYVKTVEFFFYHFDSSIMMLYCYHDNTY